MTVGFINQYARAYNASITAKAFRVDGSFDLEDFVGISVANRIEEFDALDRLNYIPDQYVHQIGIFQGYE